MATETKKVRGILKTIKPKEGYAFITDAATGEDYFMHRSSVDAASPVGWDALEEDMPVEFVPIDGPKGLRAVEVRVITAQSEREADLKQRQQALEARKPIHKRA